MGFWDIGQIIYVGIGENSKYFRDMVIQSFLNVCEFW